MNKEDALTFRLNLSCSATATDEKIGQYRDLQERRTVNRLVAESGSHREPSGSARRPASWASRSAASRSASTATWARLSEPAAPPAYI